MKPFVRGFRWNWIGSRRTDLLWYIGSALAGWSYIALVLFLGRGLSNPLHDPFYTVNLGGQSLSLTLGLLVIISWSFLIDPSHLCATLVRTYLDPDEWRYRGRELLLSLVWFIAGPITLVAPYLLGIAVSLSPKTMALGGKLFFAFFRIWGYYHVVRQHWGFFVLYKHKNEDLRDPVENEADWYFFHLSLYLPPLISICAPWQSKAGFDIDLDLGFLSAISGLRLVYPVAVTLYVVTVLGYLGFQVIRLFLRIPRNGPKLLLLLSIAPLHFVVFWNPLLTLFAAPIITVGHNLQYHRIVWMYGQNKYGSEESSRYRWTKPIFERLWRYVLLGGIFTFFYYWMYSVGQTIAPHFDRWIFAGIGIMAGITDPSTVGIGAEVAWLFFCGWAMQHYYLDGKIWRLGGNQTVAGSLGV